MKSKLTFFASLPFISLISVLPDNLFYKFSNFLAFVLQEVLGYRKKIVMQNLRASFPNLRPEELKKTMSEFYINLADTLLESLKMGIMSKNDISQRITIEGIEHLKSYHEQGRSVICVTGHYANWEWAGLAISAAYKKFPILIVYQPMSNRYHENYFNSLRSKFGAIMVSMKNIARQVIARRKQPSLIILVADQAPSPNEKNHSIQFLNQQTSFFNGAEKLSRISNAALIFAEINRVGRGFYTIKLVPLVKEPTEFKENEITESHVHHLEQVIKNHPSDWLWSHRRWKNTPAFDFN